MYDLGDGAGVLVQPRQHRHVARPRLRGHPRVRHPQHAWKIFVPTEENICTVSHRCGQRCPGCRGRRRARRSSGRGDRQLRRGRGGGRGRGTGGRGRAQTLQQRSGEINFEIIIAFIPAPCTIGDLK